MRDESRHGDGDILLFDALAEVSSELHRFKSDESVDAN